MPAEVLGKNPMRRLRYSSRSASEARTWQETLREELFRLLAMRDLVRRASPAPHNAEVLSREDAAGFEVSEVEFDSTPARRIRAIVTSPVGVEAPWPGVVCIHGHSGSRRTVYDDEPQYGRFAAELAASGYATVSADVGQHEVFEQPRLLMGERLWDLMRCVDWLDSAPGVDASRMGCAGLSLGGEMAMWLGAMDPRVAATVSAGFLTTMDAMEQDHCMCWKFPGLRELVDYADIYSLIAPRPLLCQNGAGEEPSQFPPDRARAVMEAGIKPIYRDLGCEEMAALDVHDGAHVIDLPALTAFLAEHLRPGLASRRPA